MRFFKPLSVVFLSITMLILFAGAVTAVEEPGCYFGDGRINSRAHRDCAAPVAIYMTDQEVLVLAYDASIANKPEQFIIRHPRNNNFPADANEILAQATNPVTGRPVVLSRLTTGEYQLNTFRDTGVPYIVVWYAGNDLYHLDPETGAPLDGATTIIVPGGRPAPSSPPPTDNGETTVEEGEEAPTSETAANAVGLNNCRVTTTRILRLRTAPSTETGEIITRLPYRTTWQVTERTAGWFRIIFEDRQGWVSADFVNTSGDCEL